ncbi:SRPBCC family protein [Galactobacter caseinivorans]|uniref:SRPBCC domain-containing protein n=1 Tax=Galactobacter caseinivorans TaxID=2676123 RepID=A0A496PIY6_9MICC|nr:SRPBCC domain-containing protein [Galactobacter caseinivorans]RKW70408.1 SRPBCC domain-containing protein [Galactobacter caseinivorans]
MTEENVDQSGAEFGEEALVEGITIDRVFDAPPAAVFAAWTQAESFSRWFGGPDIEVPMDRLDYVAQPGREWRAVMVLPDGNTMNWAGNFETVEPDASLVLTITDRPDEPTRAKITVDLSPEGEGTAMYFAQDTPGFTPEQQDSLVGGWNHFFDEMAKVAGA